MNLEDELFKKEDYLTDEGKADYAFTKSYNGLRHEVNRVANEKITIWGKIVMWIYSKIHRDPYHFKSKQISEEKYESAEAFNKLSNKLEKKKDSSMSNNQIMHETRKTFP